MRKNLNLSQFEAHFARDKWPGMSRANVLELRELVKRYQVSVALGDVSLIENHWYITHSGLLRLSERRRCCGIRTSAETALSSPASGHWVFKATVYKSPRSRGFVGYGDANPSNVSPLVRGAEMRVAETRAVSRALRKAYGIGLCSVEELGSVSFPVSPSPRIEKGSLSSNGNGASDGQPRLRDRLCLLIRQHQLDPALVKRYAADFCGTATLREASRELIESFIKELSEWATRDREALVCHLNNFSHSQEVRS